MFDPRVLYQGAPAGGGLGAGPRGSRGNAARIFATVFGRKVVNARLGGRGNARIAAWKSLVAYVILCRREGAMSRRRSGGMMGWGYTLVP